MALGTLLVVLHAFDRHHACPSSPWDIRSGLADRSKLNSHLVISLSMANIWAFNNIVLVI
jgi:hypothetical protein